MELKDLPKNVRLSDLIRAYPKDLNTLVNPRCKRCYGKGFTGVNIRTKMKTVCTAKGCLIDNLIKYQA